MRYLSLKDAGVFHGHLGPYLALGYMAGRLAVSILKPTDELGMEAIVECPGERPYTCFVDGVQCSTKCTLGKGNLKLVQSEGLAVTFIVQGGKLKIRVRHSILEKLAGYQRMEDAVRWILSMQPEEVFELY